MRKPWEALAEELGSLVEAVRSGSVALVTPGEAPDEHEGEDGWDQCLSLLERVLIPEDEYAWIKLRIYNARHYVLGGEVGAAHYEMRLVVSRVKGLHQLYG